MDEHKDLNEVHNDHIMSFLDDWVRASSKSQLVRSVSGLQWSVSTGVTELIVWDADLGHTGLQKVSTSIMSLRT